MYKLTKDNNSIIRLSDNAHIPFAIGNRDYAEYQEWLAAGNTPEPWKTEQELYDDAVTSVRSKRNQLLKDSDWAILPDAPTDKEVWAIYRQQLRDVTEQPGFPFDVIFPEAP